jgi:hypothetical protein
MYYGPPANLNFRKPLLHKVAATDPWYRSYAIDRMPIFFGKNHSQRWDDPDGKFGVLYLGADASCAFMESIGRGVLKSGFVPKSMLLGRGLAKVHLKREIQLINLVASGGLARIGLEGSLVSGSGYKNSQRWSRKLRAHPSKPHGIYYRSRHDQALCAAALYDQCEPWVEVIDDYGPWATQPSLLGQILDHYQFGTDLRPFRPAGATDQRSSFRRTQRLCRALFRAAMARFYFDRPKPSALLFRKSRTALRAEINLPPT